MLSSIFSSYALLLLCFSHHLFCSATARDTLTSHDNPIRDDGSEGLVSAGGRFELGFFTPPSTGAGRSSNGRYVGIWYHQLNPRTVVWVSNRDKPVPANSTANSTGVFAINEGNLHVLDATTGEYYWSAKASSSALNPMVKLMDSGNLVLSDGNDPLAVNNILWQSFESATDTFIPGMIMDNNMELISWRGEDDPGIGNFTFKLDVARDNQNQYMITKLNSIVYWKSGEPGEFSTSAKMPLVITYLLSNFSMRVGELDILTNIPQRWDYNYTRLVMNFAGELQYLNYTKQWNLLWEPKDRCNEFNACGNFGSCNINNRPWECKCLPGFSPRFVEQWNSGNFSGGCARQSKICEKNDMFLSLTKMKVGKPNTSIKVDNETECMNECLSNCSCQAYSYAANNPRRDASTSCRIWLTELNNLEEEYGDDGHNIFVRIALSNSESTFRDCEPCGTTIIPYPLSTGPNCGDPMYYRFYCNNIIGQVSFMGANGEVFRVISINPSTQRFVIQVKNVDNCDPIKRVKSQQLNTSFPFNVTSWCDFHLGDFSSQLSLEATNALELGWALPPEPTCTTSTNCKGWPHSTCSLARDRKKRCLCNANYQWSSSNLNCTQEGNLQQTPKLEEQPRSKVPVSLILIVVVVVTSGIFLACLVSVYIWRRKITKGQDKINRAQLDSERRVQELIDTGEFKEEDEKGIDVPFFDLQSILDATDNFSDANKLGQGGYGPVYKGKFLGDQEIAVKRLSRASGQGLQEFKNEVVLIAKLQHRNLVRLRGYCVKGEEKILLYEYMPNKSLDIFIFDHTKSMVLNWEMRFNIILGIVRGLLYLHQDSRLRIIHRDLKTSNILLDEEMNPKISDFGLARIVGGKETESNTNTVVGTYGYMSPEYALDGTFSVKSDVYSFGVVLLEIISGKKNTGFYQSKQTFSLINYAWRLWTENKGLELMDKTLNESCNKSQFIKCVNVGLLCVQEDPVDRPTMSNVLTMLDSEIAISPTPKQPAFLIRRGNSSTTSSTKPETFAEITTTLDEGR
ncbi:G-type lectin S-receptor-like serine/threonine-protein kinase [Prunus yedoensis var. nudiflora]|uniref:non-specific serine/threonine protein kinase n=1 Tax=Prunus yedoensis var. nudiflora TaxID=2094558 RepID=A0A314YBR0_PRUYE|nr:G-type lectin S-receptor-like serine/threonine-protein kinase [Prunus yedoensis var. nudiflora]